MRLFWIRATTSTKTLHYQVLHNRAAWVGMSCGGIRIYWIRRRTLFAAVGAVFWLHFLWCWYFLTVVVLVVAF